MGVEVFNGLFMLIMNKMVRFGIESEDVSQMLLMNE